MGPHRKRYHKLFLLFHFIVSVNCGVYGNGPGLDLKMVDCKESGISILPIVGRNLLAFVLFIQLLVAIACQMTDFSGAEFSVATVWSRTINNNVISFG